MHRKVKTKKVPELYFRRRWEVSIHISHDVLNIRKETLKHIKSINSKSGLGHNLGVSSTKSNEDQFSSFMLWLRCQDFLTPLELCFD